ncbi:hypothetical protein [Oceanicaulis alexandrii]|uniref:hypothetical protein n=1 Tax=Oceanicaulis alexandrii TaxID=153233 RepID=UPI003B507246
MEDFLSLIDTAEAVNLLLSPPICVGEKLGEGFPAVWLGSDGFRAGYISETEDGEAYGVPLDQAFSSIMDAKFAARIACGHSCS